MSWSNYMQQQILDQVHKLATGTFATTVYIGLSSTLGVAAGTGFTEPTIGTNSYARLSITQATDLARTSQAVSNSGAKSFAASTGAWLSGTTLPYFTVWDAASAGNLLWYGLLTTARAVSGTGVTLTIAAGEISSRADLP